MLTLVKEFVNGFRESDRCSVLFDEFEIDESTFATYTVNNMSERVPFRETCYDVNTNEEYVTHGQVANPVHRPVENYRNYWFTRCDEFNSIEKRPLDRQFRSHCRTRCWYPDLGTSSERWRPVTSRRSAVAVRVPGALGPRASFYTP